MLKCMCLEATSHGLRRPKNKVSLLEEAEKNLQSQHEGKGVSWSAFPWLQAGGWAASPGVTVGHGEETRRLGSAGVELSCRLRAFPAFSLLHPSQPAGLYLSPHSLSTILCSCPWGSGGRVGRGLSGSPETVLSLADGSDGCTWDPTTHTSWSPWVPRGSLKEEDWGRGEVHSQETGAC